MDIRQKTNPIRYWIGSFGYMFFSNVFTLGRSRILYKELRDTLEVPLDATIVELGCGPGVVTGYLREKIGPEGEIVAVDFAPTMIEQALKRKADNGWDNVEYTCGDATDFCYSRPVDAIVFSLSLTAMPDYEKVLNNALSALKDGGQLIILDSIPYAATSLTDLTANFYLLCKSLFVGAKPEPAITQYCEKSLDGMTKEKRVGGVYTLITGRKPIAA